MYNIMYMYMYLSIRDSMYMYMYVHVYAHVSVGYLLSGNYILTKSRGGNDCTCS